MGALTDLIAGTPDTVTATSGNSASLDALIKKIPDPVTSPSLDKLLNKDTLVAKPGLPPSVVARPEKPAGVVNPLASSSAVPDQSVTSSAVDMLSKAADLTIPGVIAKVSKSALDLGTALGSPDTPEQVRLKQKVVDAGKVPDQSSILQDLSTGMKGFNSSGRGNALANLQQQLDVAKQKFDAKAPYMRDRVHQTSYAEEIRTLGDKINQLHVESSDAAKLPSAPQNPVYEAASINSPDAVTTLKVAGKALTTDPWGYLRSSAAQNLPSSIFPMIGGALGGIVGNEPGAAAGAGFGSFISERGSDIEDGLQKFGADLTSPASRAKIWQEHGSEIIRRANNKAAWVAAADALGGGLTAKIASLPVKGFLHRGAQVVGGMGTDALAGMSGEAAGQISNDGRVTDVNAVLQEALGGFIPGGFTEGVQIAGHLAKQSMGSAHGTGQTEEDYKRLWNESQPKDPVTMGPVDPISTYQEATKSGRVMYGFDDGTGSVKVGSYQDAEAVMGAGDGRRGRIIAVRPDQVARAVPATINPEELTTKLETVPIETIKRELTSAGASPAFVTDIADFAKTLVGNTTMTRSDVTSTVKQYYQDHSTPLYNGSTQGLGITPRADNLLHVTALTSNHTAVGDVVYGESQGNSSRSSSINLDGLQASTAKRGYVVVPGSVKTRVASSQGLLAQVDSTFTFASPTARQEFLQADSEKMRQLFASKQVQWSGQLDERFMLPGSRYANDVYKGFQVVDANGKTVNKTEVTQLLRQHQTAYSGSQEQVVGLTSRRSPTIDESLKEPMGMEAAQLLKDQGNKSVAEFLLNDAMTPIVKWLKSLHSLVKIKNPVAFVHVKEVAPGQFSINPDFAIKYPQLAKFIVQHTATGNALGFFFSPHPGLHVIVQPEYFSKVLTTQELIKTVAHEFGHVVSADRLTNAPLQTLIKIFGAYRRMREAMDRLDRTLPTEDNKITDRIRVPMKDTGYRSGYEYYSSMEEWIAEQTARWALTDEYPVGALEKFFKVGSDKIAEVFKAKNASRDAFRAEPEFADWLDSLRNGTIQVQYSSIVETKMAKDSLKINAKYDANPVPGHEATSDIANVLNEFGPMSTVFNSPATKQAAHNAGVTKAVIDKYNWFYKWTANLRQLSEANPHIKELQLLRELFNFSKDTSTNIMTGADASLQKWRKLGEKRGNLVSAFLFDLNEMNYRTDAERENLITRWPTEQEFVDLAKQYKMDAEMIEVYKEARDFFKETIQRQGELQIESASKIADPALQAGAILEAQKAQNVLLSKPYFPQMRFGKFTLTVRNVASGKMEHFSLHETAKEAKAARESMLKNVSENDFELKLSTLADDVMPFVGMSPWMLDKIRNMPGITLDQINWIDQLKFQNAPSGSFAKHMIKRKNYAGHSVDGRRTFASYAFHHARNFARIKYADQFREAMNSLKNSTNPNEAASEVSRRVDMFNFVNHQYGELMNPTQDWAQLRAMNAMWHLGFNAKSAVVNMTQILVSSAFLGAKFGGFIKAESALLQASGKLSTFYRKGTYKTTTDVEFKAIAQAIADGHIDESMAAELAALAVGGGMGARIGKSIFGDNVSHGFQEFSEKAMWMFRMAEQWQRRIVFRASWQLAMNNPTNKWLQSLRVKHSLKHAELVNGGWTDGEALAYLAGMDTIVSTLGVYDRQSRPRYMQGKRSVVFAFQMFTQQNLWMLWNNKDMMLRHTLYMALLGGAMGILPDDLKGLFNAMGRIAFGNGFDLERQVRQFIVEMMGSDSKLPPDLILHGSSRYGFGIPKVMQTLGAKFVPEVDLSNSLSLGRLLPVDVGKMFKPGTKWTDTLASAADTAAGAAYSVPLAMIKALSATDMETTDFKRWEGAMPTALRNLSKVARLTMNGGDTNKMGAVTLPFDGEDPEQAGEIIATSLGFQPTRVSQHYDRQTASREIDAFWQTRKQLLLRQAYRDKFVHQDDKAFDATLEQIKAFNKEAIDPRYVITRQTLQSSLKARALDEVKVESGQNVSPAMTGAMDKMYPESKVVVRKVK